MKKDFIIDYLSYILFKALGFFIRSLPKGFSLYLGKKFGGFLYYFDLKHKAQAYSNVKTAFGDKLSPSKLNHLTHEFYRNFGQSLFEIFLIPLVNKEYLKKYITIEGLDNIASAFKKGKGVIFLGMHEGCWELSNIISAHLGFSFSLFVRNHTRFTRLEKLLNSYRIQKGGKIIQRQNQLRWLVDALKNNEAIGMTLDQGGKTGGLVKFFGKYASMATGAIRLALKYDAVLLPVFYTRISGPYNKLIINSPFEIKKTTDPKRDIQDNLERAVSIFEKYITTYPQEYLWSYKIWKYSNEKNILILSDGKTGHIRQAERLANIVSNYLKEKGLTPKVEAIEIKFRNKLSRFTLTFSSCLAGRYHCQGCLWCLRSSLRKDVYGALLTIKPDMIISCGSNLAPINFTLSRENLAKSIVVLKPSILSTRRFDLVIIPKHDRPPQRRNVVETQGALNLIDEDYLREQSEKLIQAQGLRLEACGFYIGLLIGGDTKNFHLKVDIVSDVARQLKAVSEKLNADILVTTSRRTSREIEELVKEEFKDYFRCRLLVIANEKNIPEAIGGILGLSHILVSSCESISMISEAVNSKKYVLVFKSPGLNKRHKRFLDYFAKNKYIYPTQACDLSKKLESIWLNKPPINTTGDNLLINEAIGRIM